MILQLIWWEFIQSTKYGERAFLVLSANNEAIGIYEINCGIEPVGVYEHFNRISYTQISCVTYG